MSARSLRGLCGGVVPQDAVIAAGALHSLAVRSDGTVWAWGWNESGQVRDGTTTSRSTPVQVLGLADVHAIAARGDHALGALLRIDGMVGGWAQTSWISLPLKGTERRRLEGRRCVAVEC